MAFIVKHVNKKSGTVYVYRCESYWDKEKKTPRNRQVCIGKEDPKTHETVPCRAKTRNKDHFEGVRASCKLVGGTLLLEAIDKRLGVSKTVEKAFGELSPKIMSLVYYLTQKGQPLSRCETWSAVHVYYNPVKAAHDTEDLAMRLLRLKGMVERGERIDERDESTNATRRSYAGSSS